jgi:serine/threonine protein kinase
MRIEAGQMIDRYHIVEQVGEGGMATVYKAFDTRLEREVALKIIRREGKALARLSHNHMIKVFD